MFKTALLVVTKPLSQLRENIPAYLSQINRLVSEAAYIHIHPDAWKLENNSFRFDFLEVPYTTEIRNVIKDFYTSSSQTCSNVDIRVLVGHFTNPDKSVTKYRLKKSCDIVLVDQQLGNFGQNDGVLLQSFSKFFRLKDNASLQSIDVNFGNDSTAESAAKKTRHEDASVSWLYPW